MSSVQFTDPPEDVSPKTTAPATSTSNEYFTNEAGGSTTSAKTSDSVESSEHVSSVTSDQQQQTPTNDKDSEDVNGDKVDAEGPGLQRQSSVSSVQIQLPRNQNLPQGSQKRINKGRLRNASPKPNRFQNRVAFDNLPLGEATKNNISSLTLTVKHKGYRPGRRSRTFMVGVDEHAYSDYALEWLLDELVDDGDEVVCVRVIEKEIRTEFQQYQAEAQSIMRSIVEKSGANRALSLVLEYASGKLHSTFQKLIHMHEPAMLVVGTRGRSLGGLQSLVNTRNSFSKYCLQYSPVPVVVVRPTEKRNKKKEKRAADSTRRTYASMLAATQGKHEADSEATRSYDFEVQISADEEAHQVAKVLGLPASFDPTIKPLANTSPRIPRSATQPTLQATQEAPEETKETPPVAPVSVASDSSDSEDEDGEGDFEVMDGKQMLDHHKKEQLHEMEMGEAAALKRKVDSDEESDDENKAAS